MEISHQVLKDQKYENYTHANLFKALKMHSLNVSKTNLHSENKINFTLQRLRASASITGMEI